MKAKRKRKYHAVPVVKITADMLNIFGVIVDIAILISIWLTHVMSLKG